MEFNKPYPAGLYKCDRYDIADDETTIEVKKDLIVMQPRETALFKTVRDAANHLERSGKRKEMYYGQLLKGTPSSVFA